MDAAARLPLLERLRRRFRPPRRAVPTRAGFFVLAAPIVLGVAAVSASNNLLFMLLAAALGAVVLSGILSERNIRGVRVQVRALTPAYVDEPCRLEVRYERPAALGPAYGLLVRELDAAGLWTPRRRRRPPHAVQAFLPILEAGSGSAPALRQFPRRGRASVPLCELVTRFPFGLLNKARDVEVDLDVLVRPRRVKLPAALEDPRRSAGEGDWSERRGHGFELYGLRERQEWDAAHRVHALRSLSLGREVVLETAQVERPTAWLGVACTPGVDPEALERALELAAAALSAWEADGFAVGLAVGAAVYPPGEVSLDGLLDALAAAAPTAAAPSGRRRPGLWLVPAGARPPGPDVVAMAVSRQGTLTGGASP
jgi:uncharacterized protein (DUF58 family)